MWLRDSLGHDLKFGGDGRPVARIIIYGYESCLAGTSNFQNLEDLATSFHTALLALLQGKEKAS
jgi:protein SERAC1